MRTPSRPLTVATAVLAVAVAIPAAALAIARNHTGEFEGAPTSYIAFDLDRTGSGKVVELTVLPVAD